MTRATALRPLLLAVPLFVTAATGAHVSDVPADWTQFGGPNRNFVVDAKGLAAAWPEGGPKTIWKRALGEGFSAAAIDGTTLYTMYERGEDEVIVALDAGSGKTTWEHAYHAPITVNMSRAPGPRVTPLVVGNRVFTVGATGKLAAVDKRTGRLSWSHDLFEEYKGYVQDEYYSASPLAWRNTIIVPVGGAGASVMAFDQQTGAVVWKGLDFKTSYASPILIDVDGQAQVVLMMESEIIGIDPATGALLWSHPHANQTKTNVSTPVWGPGNLLFCSSAYNSGSRVLKLTRAGGQTKVEELWYNRNLRVHQGNAIRIGDTVYGSSGDFGPTFFSAVDIRTGELRWQQRDVVKSSFIYADGRFIMLNEDGELLLATPAGDGLKVASKAQVLTKTAWTPPTLNGTTLYVRDRKDLVALDLR
jgi:outer membrane protein assembly factor BamB